ncbi:hypothetical protein DFP72DRAFT_843939 [Ephemerocybe angulata]|uniref:Uncharacterized protein n=1 Tax=Ephemerocybe angulata TaxID=980116 RepID=A0A8H6I6H6_9AGAR|nr:hypothetical protein DFP72DRAFT_843939 [Tulosesus angulatus]
MVEALIPVGDPRDLTPPPVLREKALGSALKRGRDDDPISEDIPETAPAPSTTEMDCNKATAWKKMKLESAKAKAREAKEKRNVDDQNLAVASSEVVTAPSSMGGTTAAEIDPTDVPVHNRFLTTDMVSDSEESEEANILIVGCSILDDYLNDLLILREAYLDFHVDTLRARSLAQKTHHTLGYAAYLRETESPSHMSDADDRHAVRLPLRSDPNDANSARWACNPAPRRVHKYFVRSPLFPCDPSHESRTRHPTRGDGSALVLPLAVMYPITRTEWKSFLPFLKSRLDLLIAHIFQHRADLRDAEDWHWYVLVFSHELVGVVSLSLRKSTLKLPKLQAITMEGYRRLSRDSARTEVDSSLFDIVFKSSQHLESDHSLWLALLHGHMFKYIDNAEIRPDLQQWWTKSPFLDGPGLFRLWKEGGGVMEGNVRGTRNGIANLINLKQSMQTMEDSMEESLADAKDVLGVVEESTVHNLDTASRWEGLSLGDGKNRDLDQLWNIVLRG